MTKPLKPRSATKTHAYRSAAGGWGSLRGLSLVELRERSGPGTIDTLRYQNKAGGTMCTSCAWAKPPHPHPFEFCENGAKATIWDLTPDRCTPEFFAQHTVTELRGRSAYALEMQGRLTHPLRYDPETDRYHPVAWADALAAIGHTLRRLDPKTATFYASGKASLETSYLYALFARLYGHNNLPDSSNMCHETTSVGLKRVIGSPVGTCTFEDLDHCDAIFHFGQNPGTNSPRLLHPLQAAAKRGCKIVVFNPVREKGLIEFINPQNPLQMITRRPTQLADIYLQVRPGGDIAAILGLCKRVIERDAQSLASGGPGVLDRAFIAQHTTGIDAFLAQAAAAEWAEIERIAGLARADLEAAADVYVAAERVIGIYGMGLTQHVHGSQSLAMLVNLFLLRGNIGRQGAGISPVRGHSNVQGQRTVGITEKPELAPMAKYRELFGFEPPSEEGFTTVTFLEGLLAGRASAFIGLGGNLAAAIPDHTAIHPAWRSMELTVHVATKLNHTHLMPGRQSYILPCLVRAEADQQSSGPQTVSVEDSFSHVYGSIGRRTPASEHLKSELAIVCGLAQATLAPNPACPWDDWCGDYALVRDLIARTFPDQFHDMGARMMQPGGFYRGNPAHERIWRTASGKAEFTATPTLCALGVGDAPGRMHLVTLRSNDQFNTTIYGHEDRLRGLNGSRMILLINPADMQRHGLAEGDRVSLEGDAEDGAHRRVDGLAVTPYQLPDGCLAGYYPELNPLIPLWYHDQLSKTPAAKGIPVRIAKPS